MIDRRLFLASLAVAPYLGTRERLARRVFSVQTGERGGVTLNGQPVKAIACCPGDGWADCHVDQEGRAVRTGEPSHIERRKVLRARLYGRVTFAPFRGSQ